jgi:Acetyltransferase (GNAT) domain
VRRLAGVEIVPPSEVPFDALVDLDAGSLPAPRPELLRAWLDQPDLIARAATRAGGLVGFAAARPARLGWKIAPVLASEAAVAEALIAEVVGDLADVTECWLDVPDPNTASQGLMAAHGLARSPTSGRTFRGWSGPPPDPATMFALLAHEVG